jgi:hypothetical protein
MDRTPLLLTPYSSPVINDDFFGPTSRSEDGVRIRNPQVIQQAS